MAIYKHPSKLLFIIFIFVVACREGGGRVLFLFYQVSTKCVAPISLKKKKLSSEISPSFPFRFKVAWINWKSATNKEEKMNSSTTGVK